MNYNTGCARPTAVAPKPLGLWRCFQGKSWRKYLYFAYKSAFQRVRAILKAPGTVKVKLWCFKGIGNPTDIHGSWGTWLVFSRVMLSTWHFNRPPVNMSKNWSIFYSSRRISRPMCFTYQSDLVMGIYQWPMTYDMPRQDDVSQRKTLTVDTCLIRIWLLKFHLEIFNWL